jgi:hypothetical protein
MSKGTNFWYLFFSIFSFKTSIYLTNIKIKTKIAPSQEIPKLTTSNNYLIIVNLKKVKQTYGRVKNSN